MAPKHPSSRAQSREPAKDPEPQPQQQHEKRGRSRSTRRRSPSLTSTISDSGAEEIFPPEAHRKRRGKKHHQSNLPVLDEVEATGKEVANTAGNAVSTVGNAAGNVAGAAAGAPGDKPLKLRLDLNLDADIRLTAKVHGDVTLSLL